MEAQEFLPYINTEEEDMKMFRSFCLEYLHHKETVKKGGTVLVPAHDLCGFLNKGCLKVFFGTDAGNERLMWFLESGNMIPEGSGDVFCKRIVADQDSEIYYVTMEDILQFALQSQRNLKIILDQYRKRQVLCVQGQLKEIEQNSTVKILKFLHTSAVLYGKQTDQGILLDNLPSRNDIASNIGVHRSNVTRFISKLEKDGVLQKVGKHILIKDLALLEEMIEAELIDL